VLVAEKQLELLELVGRATATTTSPYSSARSSRGTNSTCERITRVMDTL